MPAGRCSAPTFAPALKPKKDEASVVVTAVYSLYIRTMSTPQGTHGGMATFNIQHGFVEALVRGMRSSFLGDADYHHLTQCETLEDVKLNLSEMQIKVRLVNFIKTHKVHKIVQNQKKHKKTRNS